MSESIDPLLQHETSLRRAAQARTGNTADADDLLQDVWLAVLEAPRENVHSEKSWLFGVLRHVSVSSFRRDDARRRRERAVARDEVSHAHEQELERAALRRRLLSAIMELNDPRRQVVLLRFLSDMQPKEIATYLGMNTSTVRGHLKRALEQLRNKLGFCDSDNRRNALAVLFPAWSDERWAIPAAAKFAAIAACVLVCSWALIALFNDDNSEAGIPEYTHADLEKPLRREVVRHSSVATKADDLQPESAPRSKAPALTGRITLIKNGGPVAAALTIEARPALVGAAAQFLGIAAFDHHLRRLDKKAQKADFSAGSSFTIPCGKPGQYQLLVTSPEMPGCEILNQATPETISHHIRLLHDIDLRLAHQGLRFVQPDDTPEALELAAAENERIVRPGPWLPGVTLAVRDFDSDLVWQLHLRESAATLAPPQVLRWRSFQLKSTATSAPAFGVKVRLRVEGRDNRAWACRLPTSPEGTLRIPQLAMRDRAVESTLEFHLGEGEIVKMNRQQMTLEGLKDGDSIYLSPATDLEGLVIEDDQGHPIADAVAIPVGQAGPRGWSVTDAGGICRPGQELRLYEAAIAGISERDRRALLLGDPNPPQHILLWHQKCGFDLVRMPATPRLQWAPAPVRTVTVVGADDAPLAGVEVRLVPKKAFYSERYVSRSPWVTDSDGQVVLPPLPFDRFSICLSRPNCENIVLPLEENRTRYAARFETRGSLTSMIQLVDSSGFPMSDIRVQLRDPETGTRIRRVSDNKGSVFFEGLVGGRPYRLEAWVPGFELSLQQENLVHGGEDKKKFVLVREGRYDFQLSPAQSEDGDFVAVIASSEDKSGRRRAFFSDGSVNHLKLTAEPQQLTFYRRGFRPLSMDWNPIEGSVKAALHPGPRLCCITADESGSKKIVIRPDSMAKDSRHAEPLQSVVGAFTQSVETDETEIDCGALAPGRYTVELWRGGKRVASEKVNLAEDNVRLKIGF